MRQYFPKPYGSFGRNINVKVDLSYYATKTDLKNVAHVDVSIFPLKSSLAGLKTEIDELDIDKLAPVPVDLSKLSDAVKKHVVKKTEYDKLVTNVDNIDTTTFVLKTAYDKDKSDLENKIGDPCKSDKSVLAKKADLNPKITEIEGKITSIYSLVINSALTAVENKIPNVSSLFKKQIMIKKFVKLKRRLVIIIIRNTLLLQNLII